jgi:hypothetical protein
MRAKSVGVAVQFNREVMDRMFWRRLAKVKCVLSLSMAP